VGRAVAVAPVRRIRGRARVHPRVRRRPRSAEVTPHRRRLPRSSLRKWEAVAWIAAIGVVATMVGFVIRSAPATAPFVQAQPSTAPVAGRSSPQCFIAGCPTSYPAGPPTRVQIPSIGVDSTLETLVLDSHRELTPPASYDKAGWFAGGPVPGDRGPAIIAGHVDSIQGPGVFFKLHTLQAKARISVLRGGVWVRFRVTRVEEYPKDQFPSVKIYQPTPDAELRVITCGGDFDNVHKRYYDNIVVYAVLE
jgi:Sortase domain